MTILSPLKPLLCRHEYYWSERHRSDRCRSCGKLKAGEQARDAVADAAVDQSSPAEDAPFSFGPAEFTDIPEMPAPGPIRIAPKASAKALKAQAQARREKLLDLLDRLSQGRQPNREETIDAVLAVIEDAHSADPILFGEGAATHFAKLYDARHSLIF